MHYLWVAVQLGVTSSHCTTVLRSKKKSNCLL